MRCDTHNREMLRLGEKAMCPACLAASSAPATQVWNSLTERMAANDLHVRMQDAAIPHEFAGKTFADFNAETERASKLVQVLSDYSSSFASSRHKRKGFLFIGQPGTAKTHLACAMVTSIVEQGMRAGYVNLPRLTRDIRAAYGRTRGVEDLMRKLIAMDLLVVDEIDLHGTSDNDYNMLYDIINSRYEKPGCPTVAISNRSLDRLEQDLDERVVSRILAGTSPVVFDWPGRRETRRRSPASGEAAQ